MNFSLKIWRQKDAKSKGAFKTYRVENISPDTSFLEMLDILNNDLIHKGEEPVVFDHDCREGICGMCSLHINGHAHGPDEDITTCQLHMRKFHDGETITIEPWRSRAFPVIKDLAVDRSAFDKILQAGGFVSVGTGGVPDANTIPIPKPDADESMDAAACIGCGACLKACPFEAPSFSQAEKKMYKCDGCASRLAKGQQPACVQNCTCGALEFGPIEELRAKYPKAETKDFKWLKKEFGMAGTEAVKPRLVIVPFG